MHLAWNTLSLVHVMEFPTEGKEPGSRMMLIDSGTAATGISDLSPDVCAVLAEHADEVGKPSVIAYVGNAHRKILIIGSSAGEQVLDVFEGSREFNCLQHSDRFPVASQKRSSRR